MLTDTCSRCEGVFLIEDLIASSKTAKGYINRCKECERKRCRAKKARMTPEEITHANRNWRTWKRDPEKEKEWARKKRENRRVAEKKWPPLPKNTLALLIEKYGCCLKCGRTDQLQRDHVIPLSKGGPNTMDNLQLLCIECNARKHTRVIDYR